MEYLRPHSYYVLDGAQWQLTVAALTPSQTDALKGRIPLQHAESFLPMCGCGDVLIIADQNHLSVRVITSSKEPLLITTALQQYCSTEVL